ncbi:MAG TPA: GspH/FimT family protein [Spongiibacteraceae bacterium]|nr:GspH/FimT family protein [Spongiibacteraceae bacterium]HUH37028.1 GspH/FimT family protein [Spongiibacteraceae bacterium]
MATLFHYACRSCRCDPFSLHPTSHPIVHAATLPVRCQGITLLELLMALAILAMLAAATPAVDQWISRNRATSEMLEMYRLVQYARSTAVHRNEVVTLCGSPDGALCSRDWHLPELLVFIDQNDNRLLDAGDTPLRRTRLPGGDWHWRASAGRDYLRFRSDGSAVEWGRLTQCPQHPRSATASQLVLNRVGRAYLKRVDRAQLAADGLCL